MTEISLENAKILVEEAINDRLLDLTRQQWTLISGLVDAEERGPDLETLKGLVPKLREMASSNPWHIRGALLRKVYVFGRGVNYVKVDQPRYQKILTDPRNVASLFGVDAYGVANMASFCAGNLFVLKKERENRFIVVPIEQITGFSTDPEDSTSIWYVKRTWTSNGKVNVAWYPTADFKNSGGKLVKRVSEAESLVKTDGVVYIRRSNRQDGWTWGVPDSLGALVWTEAYSAYLKDNAVLVRALSKIAWKLTSATQAGTSAAAVSVRDAGDQVGGVAAMMAGNQLQGVGVPSAQVNMGNGQPLIAAAAATFGVPVIALLSSPGETGGSYGSAATLDEPTLKTMTDLQSSWGDFYGQILRDLGAKDARLEFPAIQTDPAYRRIASINNAQQMGSIWRDEAREAIMDIEDVPRLHDGLPSADGFNAFKDPNAAPAPGSDPLARQGNTGGVPGGTDQNVTNHDGDTKK